MNAADIKRLSVLSSRFRKGISTSVEESEMHDLQDKFDAACREAQKGPQPRTVWDLPVARAMFDADRPHVFRTVEVEGCEMLDARDDY